RGGFGVKHRMFISATAVAVLALVVACSGGGGNGSDGASDVNSSSDEAKSPSGEVTFWMYPIISDSDVEAAYWDEVSKDFMDAYPDIQFNLEVQPWANRSEALASAVAAGTQPDVIYLNPDYIAQYAEMGAL